MSSLTDLVVTIAHVLFIAGGVIALILACVIYGFVVYWALKGGWHEWRRARFNKRKNKTGRDLHLSSGAPSLSNSNPHL